MNTALAYSVVFLGLAVVHIPFVLHAAPYTLWRAPTIFWKDLVASHLGHLLLYGALITWLSHAEGLFQDNREISAAGHILMVAKVSFWATLVFGLGLRLSGAAIGEITLISLAGVVVVSLAALGWMTRRVHASSAYSGRPAKNVLIVGTTRTAREIARYLGLARKHERVVKGFISRFRTTEPSVLGGIDDLARIARSEFVDEVIIACGPDRQLGERAVTEALRNHLDVSVVPDLVMDWPSRWSVQAIGAMPLIAVHEEPIPRFGLLVKRIMDVLISATALLLLLPLMLVMAAAIKLESRGSVLYGALRAGKKGSSFQCYKFRTMFTGSDRQQDELRCRNERQGPTFKLTNDPRITPLGRVLRRFSVDELPQLWNVLTGSMSMVGPRPHPLDDYRRYDLADRRRLDVQPGITGLWQITARSDPSFAANMALDLEYIENWSLGMDLAILLKTIPAVVAGTGA
ncbi:MAG TPA: sugar transferase [Terriglobales bacterium]